MFSNSKPKVLVCVLTGMERHTWLNPDLSAVLFRMATDSRFEVNYFPIKDARPVESARNMSIAVAKQMQVDWLVSIDNDNSPLCNPLDIIAQARDKQIIGLTSGVYSPAGNGLAMCPPERIAMDGDFAEVLHVGGACLMIHKSVWQKMSKGPYFRTVIPYDKDGKFQDGGIVGEDAFFCRAARAHGIKVWTHRNQAAHFRTADLTGFINAFQEAQKK